VESDKPQAEILWVNERARASGIRPGMRYAAGLSLAGDLRAAPIPEAEIRKKTKAIAARLRRYTPGVEPAADDPGVFWLDASGLLPLFDSIDTWAREVLSEIEAFRFAGVLVVGFSRFGAYALAKSWGETKLAGDGIREAIPPTTVIPAEAGIQSGDRIQRCPGPRRTPG
jgi:protein ImuB